VVSSIDNASYIYDVKIIPVRIQNGQYHSFQQFPKTDDKKNLNFFKTLLKKIYNFLNSIFGSIPLFSSLLNSYRLRLFLSRIFNRLSVEENINLENIINPLKGDTLLLLDATWSNCDYELLNKLKKQGIIIIPVIYDIIPITHSQYCQLNLVKAFEIWFKKSYNLFDFYISISDTVKHDIYKYIKNNFDKNIELKKFSSFKLGSNFKNNSNDDSIYHNRYKNLFDKNTYITVSTIEARKNHEYILNAFEILWEKGFDVKYIMIGKIGWKIKEFLSRVENHKEYNKKLFMLNDMNDNELIYAYKHSTALIFASFVEGFGLPIVESLNNNLQVLASDIPIHREVGQNYVTYFDLATPDSLAGIIEENNFYKNIEGYPSTTWEESTNDLISKILKTKELP